MKQKWQLKEYAHIADPQRHFVSTSAIGENKKAKDTVVNVKKLGNSNKNNKIMTEQLGSRSNQNKPK